MNLVPVDVPNRQKDSRGTNTSDTKSKSQSNASEPTNPEHDGGGDALVKDSKGDQAKVKCGQQPDDEGGNVSLPDPHRPFEILSSSS